MELSVLRCLMILNGRKELAEIILSQQNGSCALCKNPAQDLHEWLVKRSNLPIKRLQGKIFKEINCIYLCRKCHDSSPRIRDYKCYEYKLNFFKEEQFQEFLTELNLKTFGDFKQWKHQNKKKHAQPEKQL